MNLISMNNQKGLTLVELILFMVVLAVGLTGVLNVIMTVTNSKLEPLSQWQGIQVSSSVMETLLTKKYQSSDDCKELKSAKREYLCEYQGVNKQPLKEVFPEIASQIGNTVPLSVSIDIKPFYEEKMTRDVLAINVIVSNPQVGEIRLSAIKAMRNQDDEKAKRLHVY
ncbi:MAG: prepilin-type N-terminal cleavage/methylation domain-containing protein [Candidatus Berkiella sp.]